MNVCKISITSRIAGNPNARRPAREARQTTGVTFQINNVKLYTTAATLSINDNIKFLQNIKHGCKRQFLRTNINLK